MKTKKQPTKRDLYRADLDKWFKNRPPTVPQDCDFVGWYAWDAGYRAAMKRARAADRENTGAS